VFNRSTPPDALDRLAVDPNEEARESIASFWSTLTMKSILRFIHSWFPPRFEVYGEVGYAHYESPLFKRKWTKVFDISLTATPTGEVSVCCDEPNVTPREARRLVKMTDAEAVSKARQLYESKYGWPW
jgi:hypothetical protein